VGEDGGGGSAAGASVEGAFQSAVGARGSMVRSPITPATISVAPAQGGYAWMLRGFFPSPGATSSPARISASRFIRHVFTTDRDTPGILSLCQAGVSTFHKAGAGASRHSATFSMMAPPTHFGEPKSRCDLHPCSVPAAASSVSPTLATSYRRSGAGNHACPPGKRRRSPNRR